MYEVYLMLPPRNDVSTDFNLIADQTSVGLVSRGTIIKNTRVLEMFILEPELDP